VPGTRPTAQKTYLPSPHPQKSRRLIGPRRSWVDSERRLDSTYFGSVLPGRTTRKMSTVRSFRCTVTSPGTASSAPEFGLIPPHHSSDSPPGLRRSRSNHYSLASVRASAGSQLPCARHGQTRAAQATGPKMAVVGKSQVGDHLTGPQLSSTLPLRGGAHQPRGENGDIRKPLEPTPPAGRSSIDLPPPNVCSFLFPDLLYIIDCQPYITVLARAAGTHLPAHQGQDNTGILSSCMMICPFRFS
jgi:hypothetical protein